MGTNVLLLEDNVAKVCFNVTLLIHDGHAIESFKCWTAGSIQFNVTVLVFNGYW